MQQSSNPPNTGRDKSWTGGGTTDSTHEMMTVARGGTRGGAGQTQQGTVERLGFVKVTFDCGRNTDSMNAGPILTSGLRRYTIPMLPVIDQQRGGEAFTFS
ncbi:hypothetical protein E2C01_019701 [Portunus trituberculatus]|uniref:Uncharacterized protein n=1 Tax=Portunus trituberculatus TaxID=210409 RepID=A0A5B7DZP4_PORTR|nr:hypothetical protein [Portunus trituberculatus]